MTYSKDPMGLKPWTTHKTNAGIGIFDRNDDTICWEWDIDQQIADHMIAAVNCHDELVKLCEMMAIYDRLSRDDDGVVIDELMQPVAERARAILAKVKNTP